MVHRVVVLHADDGLPFIADAWHRCQKSELDQPGHRPATASSSCPVRAVERSGRHRPLPPARSDSGWVAAPLGALHPAWRMHLGTGNPMGLCEPWCVTPIRHAERNAPDCPMAEEHDCRCASLPEAWPRCGQRTQATWSPGCDGRAVDAALRHLGFETRLQFVELAVTGDPGRPG